MEVIAKQNLDVAQTLNIWRPLAGTLLFPHTEADYNSLVELLDELVDAVGEDELHPLASLLEVVGVLIEKYEDENVSDLAVEG
jgi:HTH-type transcriptional regulator / antitoxin HigA